jgi:curli biogenesis system outer membrane secretion channel CsgG
MVFSIKESAMKRKIILLLVFLLTSNLIRGGVVTLSVSDFPVESENSSYTHIGKGISRMVAIELRKSKSVRLIEREQLNKILEEQEFSLSDIASQDNQIKIGKLTFWVLRFVGDSVSYSTLTSMDFGFAS